MLINKRYRLIWQDGRGIGGGDPAAFYYPVQFQEQ
jgi:hypothetical protein